MVKKKSKKEKLTSFEELENKVYGKRGTVKREAYEQKFADELELLSKPGDTILETLQEKKITTSDLAEAMNITQVQMDAIIAGKQEIDELTAIGLQQCLGVDAQFWLNREKLYWEKLTAIKKEYNEAKARKK